MIIVDVLSFSTSVDIAASRGAVIFPYRRYDAALDSFAASVGAIVAVRRGEPGYSLSPASLLDLPRATRLVLPSPNGATLTLGTGGVPTLAGCLRNAGAVAAAAQRFGRRISIVPAGERWASDGSLRPAVEDWVAAGAIIDALTGTRSPEAEAAATTFRGMRADLAGLLRSSSSGQELLARGYTEDVLLAAALDVSTSVPVYRDGAYVPDGDEGLPQHSPAGRR